MTGWTDSREDQVAAASLNAEMRGEVTIETIREKYGDAEARHMMARYRNKAREFLAMYDAARASEPVGR